MRLVYLFVGILILRFVLNLSKFLRAKRYHNLYVQWLAVDRNPRVREIRAQVVALLRDAGVTDSYVATAQPMGYGHIATANTSVMANFPNAREDFVALTIGMFLEAIGTYRTRIFQTFNPLFWVEVLINLPRYALRYLGVSADAVIIKLAQIAWWIAGVVFGFLYALYRPDVETLIRGWITRR